MGMILIAKDAKLAAKEWTLFITVQEATLPAHLFVKRNVEMDLELEMNTAMMGTQIQFQNVMQTVLEMWEDGIVSTDQILLLRTVKLLVEMEF